MQDQADNYRRSWPYNRAGAQSVALSAVLLSLTTLAGTLAGLEISGKMSWAIAAAVIPPYRPRSPPTTPSSASSVSRLYATQ